jgi:hypothetical protein
MKRITELKNRVKAGDFPKEFREFGGANLIITSNPNRNFSENDVVIYTDYAQILSWLVVELKSIYDSELNYLNKYDFYPRIGELIKKSIKNNLMIIDVMIYVIDNIVIDWGEK